MNDINHKTTDVAEILKQTRRRRIWFRRFFIAAVAFLFLAAIFWHPALYVSPETTMVITPLKSDDGYPDYISQLDIPQNNKDYATEENGFAILTRECGPGLFFRDGKPFTRLDVKFVNPDFAEFCAFLGAPFQNSYPVCYYDVSEAISSTAESRSHTNSELESELEDEEDEEFIDNNSCDFLTFNLRPWKAAECPLVAQALDKNAPVYELLYQASEKRWFNPVLNTLEGGLLSGSFNRAAVGIDLVLRELLLRSALRAGEGDWDGAADDLIVCWKLGRLTNQTPLWENLLEGFRVELRAFTLAETFFNAGMPESTRKKIAAALEKFPPVPDIKQYVYNLELQFYNYLIESYKKSQNWIQYNTDSKIDWVVTALNLFPADYNIIGKRLTQWRALLDKAIQEQNPQRQKKMFADIDAQMDVHREYRKKKISIPVSLFIVPRSQMLGDIEAEELIKVSRNLDNFLHKMQENQNQIIEKAGK